MYPYFKLNKFFMIFMKKNYKFVNLNKNKIRWSASMVDSIKNIEY